MTHTYVIWPLRFTPDPSAMIDFYGRLGLHQSLSHESGTFATFVGRSGTLGVHDARTTTAGAVPGHAALNLATEDLESAAAELLSIGHEVRVWDETYGKQGAVTARDGRTIGLNQERQQDLYGGYHEHDPATAPLLDVVAVCPTPQLRAEAAWFASFGFLATSYDDPLWIGLRAGPHSGVLGVHAGEVEHRNPRPGDDLLGPAYEVRIGFETSEPLARLDERLRAAGLDPTMITDGPAPRIVLTDPDGDEVQIHPAP
jgi:predicted enzyme related to lactoylglutathione lyase